MRITSRRLRALVSRAHPRAWSGGVHAARYVQARLAKADFSMSVLVPTDFGFAGAKLSVYRSSAQWLVAMQSVGFNSESCECEDWVTAAVGTGYVRQTLIDRIDIAESNGLPALTEQPDGMIDCRLVGAPLYVRGLRAALPTSELEYRELGIHGLEAAETEISRPVALLRYLAITQPAAIFASDTELLTLLSADSDLGLFYETLEWQHPVVSRGERASQSPFFQAICRAIEADSTVELDALKRGANTSWRNWPEWPE